MNYQCSPWVKKWKTDPRKELCIDLDFQTDHLLPDSIMTLCTPYYLSLIISFFLYFPYKCLHSSFKIHSVFVTVTVATCSVYLKNLIAIHCQRPLQKHVNNHTDNVNGVTFVTHKHMSLEGPILYCCYQYFLVVLYNKSMFLTWKCLSCGATTAEPWSPYVFKWAVGVAQSLCDESLMFNCKLI